MTGVGSAANAAVTALQSVQKAQDRLRGTADINAHSNSLGLTSVINASNITEQEYPLQLWRQDKMTIRMRPLFPADTPQEAEARIANNFSQGGREVEDYFCRFAWFGEGIGGNDTMSAQFEPMARFIENNRWLLQQHSITLQEN